MPTFNGTTGADTFTAPDDQSWVINGKGGTDVLTGGGGDDIIDGGRGGDTLNGGGGNDIFLVDPLGGFDSIDGGDTTYVGADGYDVIKATADNVRIGIASITGIEEITANGFAGVSILGSPDDNIFDFRNVILTGIALIGGGAGNDTIYANTNIAATIDGGPGNDTLYGGNGDDTFLFGLNSGTDTVDGGAGFNTLQASANNAHIRVDSFQNIQKISAGGFSNVVLDVGGTGGQYIYLVKTELDGLAAINGSDDNDTILTGAGDDTIYGGAGDDLLYGGDGNDNLYGGKGVDILYGGKGDDSFYMSDGPDKYFGGTGFDTIYANQNNAVLKISVDTMNSIEALSANGFSNVTIQGADPTGSTIDLRRIDISDGDFAAINGTAGDDTILGSKASDVINGGLGSDTLNGFNGDDEIHGGAGNDTLIGGNGYDTLYGDAGDDVINGGANDDVMYGGKGDDTFIVGTAAGTDEFHGDDGFDTILADKGARTINISKIDGIEQISWNGTQSLTLHGTTSDDVFDFSGVTFKGVGLISADQGNDSITGSAGNDTIDGGDGNDTLIGGLGNDVLIGGKGLDVLTGGLGDDLFKDKAAGLNGDRITDFSGNDAIIITDAKDFTKVQLSFTEDASGTFGILHLVGIQALKAGIDIRLDGSFSTSDFVVESDGAAGALVHLVGGIPII